jgi:fermentation-respiration switch protein FrsA (DUF1100 family)
VPGITRRFVTTAVSTVAAVVIAVVIAWLVVAMMVWSRQDRVVFRPPTSPATPVPDRRVELRAADGVTTFAYVVGNIEATAPVLLAFHGNADLARWMIPWGREVSRRTGMTVVLPEYRGYDDAGGTPTTAGVKRDAAAALAWVRTGLRSGGGPVLYYGHSLGAAVAAELAADAPPAALLLEAPFTSARAMAERMFVPGLTLFWPMVSRVDYDNVERVRTLDAPVWVVHGDDDQVIPTSMGRAVFAAARRQGELLIVSGAGHADADDRGGDRYWRWIESAARSVVDPFTASGAR